MIKAIAVGLSFALSIGIASAQPAPAPAPAPTPDSAPAPTPDKPEKPKTEKVGVDESLQHGGDTRPWAAGVTVENQRTALKKFQEANAQLNDGLFANAVKLYREALTFWQHPAIHYNLALALLNLDQPLEVYDSLQIAIKYGPAPLEKEKFDHAQKYLHLVQQQIASVEVSCDKVGAKVSVDGKEVFTVKQGEVGRYKGRVKIGKHTFVAEKPGYNAQVDAPFIGPGENFRIELKLYTAEELTRYRRKWDQTWIPYAVVGGGLAIGIVGGVLELSAQSSYDEFDTEVARCNEASMQAGCNDPEVMAIRDSGDSKRTIGYIGYGLGAATITAGLVMAYLNRSESYQITADDYRREQREQGTGLSFTPIVTPEMSGAIVHGKF